jgi:hypothetical protein
VAGSPYPFSYRRLPFRAPNSFLLNDKHGACQAQKPFNNLALQQFNHPTIQQFYNSTIKQFNNEAIYQGGK